MSRSASQDVEKLVEGWAPRLRDAFVEAVERMRSQVQVDAVLAALKRGDVDAAVEAAGLDVAAFSGFRTALQQAYDAGGNSVAQNLLPTRSPLGHRLVVMFDVHAPEASAWIAAHGAEFVTGVVEEQRQVVRQFLQAGLDAGVGPRSLALDLVGRVQSGGKRVGGVIGLTASQEYWARRYADEVSGLSTAALNRNLRDRRFDGALRKAIASGVKLPQATVDKMVASYRNKALKFRGETVGRTESMTALHASQEQAVNQAVDKGQLEARFVTKTWNDAGDVRVRHTHREMNGQTVALGQSFKSPSGARLRFPGDPEAPAEERIACRCHMSVKVDYASQAAWRATQRSQFTAEAA